MLAQIVTGLKKAVSPLGKSKPVHPLGTGALGTLMVLGIVQNPQPPRNLHVETSGPRRVLQPSDLTYLGIYTLPTNIEFTGLPAAGSLALRRVNNVSYLMVSSGNTDGNLYEFVVRDNGPNGATYRNPEAAIRLSNPTVWQDSWTSRFTTSGVSSQQPSNLRGMVWDTNNSRLLMGYIDGYVTANDPSVVGVTIGPPMTGGATSSSGPWRTPASSSQRNGGMFQLPPAWVSQYLSGRPAVGATIGMSAAYAGGSAGGVHGVCLGALRVPPQGAPPDPLQPNTVASIQDASMVAHDSMATRQAGPVGRGKVYVVGWDYYDKTSTGHPAAEVAIDNKFGPMGPTLGLPTAATDWMSAAAWVQTSTKQGVIFFGHIADYDPVGVGADRYPATSPYLGMTGHPDGVDDYYEDACCPPPNGMDPWGQQSYVFSATGPGATTEIGYLLIYDPAALGAAAHGDVDPHNVATTSFVRIRTVGTVPPESSNWFDWHAAVFDPATRLLYVAQQQQERISATGWAVIIHVWRVSD